MASSRILKALIIAVSFVPLVMGFAGCKDSKDDGVPATPPPALTSVTPGTGIWYGGNMVTIKGDRFQDGASVRFGSKAALNTMFIDEGLLTAEVPSGSAGQVNVIVTNPDGLSATLTNGYTYSGPPTVTGTNPYGGPLAGTTGVQITGTGFLSGCIVLIDGVVAANVVVNSATQITCDFPAHAAGFAQVTIDNPDGQSGTLMDAFLYAVPPAPASCNPNRGHPSGGISVTITGTDFQGLATGAPAEPTVDFGSIAGPTWTAATSVVLVNATTITCTIPAGTAGTDADVRVVNPDAQPGTAAAVFHYNEAPEITNVTPSRVGTGGGATITVTGNFFISLATITINGAACTNYNYAGVNLGSNPDTITCQVPPNGVGFYDVIITNPDTQTDSYTNIEYQLGPTVTSVVPNNGDIVGGTAVVITGTNFSLAVNDVRVQFGTVWVGPLTAASATTINCNSPASGGQIGWVAVTVENITSTLSGSLTPQGFQYTDTTHPPDITNINPSSGSMAGGTTIVITGLNFWNGTTFTINGTACTGYDYTQVGIGQITCVTPAGPGPGPRNAIATNPDTTVEVAPYQTFTYTAAAPTVVSCLDGSSNAYGPMAGGTTVTVTGTGFYGIVNGATAEPAVRFAGSVFATLVTVTNSTTLTCTTPAYTAPGLVAVRVTNADSNWGEANCWTYRGNQPQITSVGGLTTYPGYSGETLVTVVGTDFWPGTGSSVTIGGVAVTPTWVGGGPPYTSFTCTLPAANLMSGLLNNSVVVTNPDTQTSNTNRYVSYRPLPNSVVPPNGIQGVATNGVVVACADSSFEAGNVTVQIGTTPITNCAVNSSTASSININIPAIATTGSFDVIVTNGTSSYNNPTPRPQFFIGTVQMWRLSSWGDFLQQSLANTDAITSPGNVQLSQNPGSFFSCGDVVTCVAYWEGGATATANRILVGTAASGAFLTTDGGTTWTAFNVYTHSNFPSNNITCVDFYNHSTSTGNTFIIGTNVGCAITYNAGSSFTVLTTSSTPALPGHNYVWDADFCDGVSTPGYILIASSDPNNWNTGGGCLYIYPTGTTVFDSTNLTPGEPGGDDDTNLVRSCDFLDNNTGQTFLIACTTNGWGFDGASFKTTNGGTGFTMKQSGTWGNTQSDRVVRFCNADTTGNTYIIGSSDNGEGAVITINDGTGYTNITNTQSVVNAAFYNTTRWAVATATGALITMDGGTSYQDIDTGSAPPFANIISDSTNWVAWHSKMATADYFSIACGIKNGNVITGALEVTTNGTSNPGQSFTRYNGNPATTGHLARPPAVLPSADITAVSMDPNDANGNRLLIGTRDGAAYTADGGTTWTWFKSGAGAYPAIGDDVRAVAVLSSGGNVYMLIGSATGLAWTGNGGTGWQNCTGNLSGSAIVSGVAFYDGTNFAVSTANPNGDVNTHTGAAPPGGTWTGNIENNQDIRCIDVYRGTASMDYLAYGWWGTGLRLRRLSAAATTYNQAGGSIPGNNVTSVSFDQGSPIATNLRLVCGTSAGGARGTGLQALGAGAWTLYTTGNGLPNNNVRGCAYFGGNAAGTHYMFATQGGVVATTDNWATRTTITRTSFGVYLPHMNSEAQACAYWDNASNTGGDRRLFASPAPNAADTGGVLLKAGVQYRTSGSFTIGHVDGHLLPSTSASTPSTPDFNSTAACFFNGSNNSNTYAIATTYGLAVTTNGGTSFTTYTDHVAGNLPSNIVTSVAVYKDPSAAYANRIILIGTLAGGAALFDGSTWTYYNTGTTPALPSNNVSWVAFHDGLNNYNTFLICTDAGTVLISGGAVVMTLDSNDTVGGQAVSNNQVCADFFDSDTTSPYSFIICACEAGGNGGGAYYTTDNGTNWTRWWGGGGLPTSYASSVAIYSATTFLIATDPSRRGQWAFNGAVSRTTNTGGAFTNFDQASGLATNQPRYVALCDQVAQVSHWMSSHANGGISVTTNGNVGAPTFNVYNTGSTPALPSNSATAGAYWSGTGANGNTFISSTVEGLMRTTNGAANLALVRITCTGYLRIDVTETLNGQTLTYDILDNSGSVIGTYSNLTPTGGSIDISGISIATYPTIQIRVNFSTSNPAQTPVLNQMDILFRY